MGSVAGLRSARQLRHVPCNPKSTKGVGRASCNTSRPASTDTMARRKIGEEEQPMWSSITHNETFKIDPPVEVFEVPIKYKNEVTHLKPVDPGSVLVMFPKATEEGRKILGITNTKRMRYKNNDVAKRRQIGVIKVIAKTSGRDRVLLILHRGAKPHRKIQEYMDRHYTKVRTPMAVHANVSKKCFEVTDDTTIQTQIAFPSSSQRSPVMAAAESANTPSKRSGHSVSTRSSPVSPLGSLGATPTSAF